MLVILLKKIIFGFYIEFSSNTQTDKHSYPISRKLHLLYSKDCAIVTTMEGVLRTMTLLVIKTEMKKALVEPHCKLLLASLIVFN